MFKINKNFYLVPYFYAVVRNNVFIEEFRHLCKKLRWQDPFDSYIMADDPMVKNEPVNAYYAFEWLWFSVGISI